MLGNKKNWVAICVFALPLAARAALVVEDDAPPKVLTVQSLLKESLASKIVIKPEAELKIAVIPKEVWIGEAGKTVRSTLEAWTKKAGWTFTHDLGKMDYEIKAPLRFEGSIYEAAAQLITLFERAQPAPVMDISVRQSLIYVTTRK